MREKDLSAICIVFPTPYPPKRKKDYKTNKKEKKRELERKEKDPTNLDVYRLISCWRVS